MFLTELQPRRIGQLPAAYTRPMAPTSPTTWQLIGQLSTIGMSFVFALVLGFGGGYWLDGWLGTKPWLSFLGFFLGLAAGILNVYRVMQLANRSHDGTHSCREGNSVGRAPVGRIPSECVPSSASRQAVPSRQSAVRSRSRASWLRVMALLRRVVPHVAAPAGVIGGGAADRAVVLGDPGQRRCLGGPSIRRRNRLENGHVST